MSSADDFPVYVSSGSGQLRCLYLTADQTVMHIKRRMEQLEGIPVNEQVVLLYGQPLHDAASLADCGVGEQTHLRVVSGAAAVAALKTSGLSKSSAALLASGGGAGGAGGGPGGGPGAAGLLASGSMASASAAAASPSVAIDVADRSKRRASAVPLPLVDLQLVKLGVCVGVLLCLFYAVVGPVFDNDENTPYSTDFVLYLAEVWKFAGVGGGAAAVLSAVRAVRQP
jgi:hypothetical protein